MRKLPTARSPEEIEVLRQMRLVKAKGNDARRNIARLSLWIVGSVPRKAIAEKNSDAVSVAISLLEQHSPYGEGKAASDKAPGD